MAVHSNSKALPKNKISRRNIRASTAEAASGGAIKVEPKEKHKKAMTTLKCDASSADDVLAKLDMQVADVLQTMELIHRGRWSVHIDHSSHFVMVARNSD